VSGDRTAARPLVGLETWRDVVFVHWNVDAAHVRARVPSELAVDLLPDGRAVVSLVALRAQSARPRFTPRSLGLDFTEVHVRTYVRAQGHGRGTHALSFDAASRAVSFGARHLFGIPCSYARLEHRRMGGAIGYRGYRQNDFSRRLSLVVEPREELGHEPDFERFVHERYAIYWPARFGTSCMRIEREPLRVVRAHIVELDETLTARAGIDVTRSFPTAYYLERVDVALCAPERVATHALRRLSPHTAARG
jgi:uncharacterized protein YqjF (DUF2071 family)